MHGHGAMFACPLGCDLGLSFAGGCCICCQDNNEADSQGPSALTQQSAGQSSKERLLRAFSADAVLFQTVLKHEEHHISRCDCGQRAANTGTLGAL